ncbi:MAG: putative toxin-antitoxin system toxin component, PIN family [Actinobacteria bacterium]|nr:putative toxin-antitoxin system toxin component, PIN family [Actinomycetota bacterium]
MGVPRVVADTNLWVAARFNPKSYSASILNMAGEGRLLLLWSSETRRELERILRNIKATLDFLIAVERLLSSGVDVGETERLSIIVDDPDDNKILACARSGNADYIITSDYHLLTLKTFGEVKIVTPKVFLESIHKKEVR